MGDDPTVLELQPRRETNSTTTEALPEGMTHSIGTPCPLAQHNFPRGSTSTCCALVTLAITGLEEWGAAKVSERMQRDMNADQALLFSETLRRTADQLLRRHPKLKDEMERLRRMCPDAKQHDWYGRYLREGEIVTIRTTADWYEQIGRLGFGVQIVDG